MDRHYGVTYLEAEIARLTAERDHLAARVAELREALSEARALLLRCLPDARPVAAPEDALIAALCQLHGSGAVIDSAARQWHLRDPAGALTVGPAAGTLRAILLQIDAALAGPADPDEKGEGTDAH